MSYLNHTATEMLTALYAQESTDVAAVVGETASRYGIAQAQIEAGLERLLRSLVLVLQDKEGLAAAVVKTPFGSHAPERGSRVRETSTAQVKRVLDATWTRRRCRLCRSRAASPPSSPS
jgi:hypothetical protein